jgi:hypothetical protein
LDIINFGHRQLQDRRLCFPPQRVQRGNLPLELIFGDLTFFSPKKLPNPQI